MHHVIVQASEGSGLRPLLEYMQALGITRVVFPACEYRHKGAGNARKSFYETARLLPRGDDGGFAERFLKERSTSRDT